jgi:hypothetical protein
MRYAPLLLAALATGCAANGPAPGAAAPERAPDFALTDLGGATWLESTPLPYTS